MLMAAFLFSAGLGAVRQVLFNAQFGAGGQASAYYAAFRLPDLLFSLVAGGALSSAMIPVLLSARREQGDEAEARLASLVLSMLVAAFAVIVLVGELAAPAFVHGVLAPGFHGETSRLTVTLTRIMLAQPLLLAAGSVATALLNSRHQFLLTAASVASHNLALIGGILATRLHPSFGIYGPTLGVVAGGLLQLLILLPGLTRSRVRWRPAFDLHDQRLREVIRLLIPNGLAVGVAYAGFIVDSGFASTAREHAALPAIYNAWLLVGLPIALLGQAVGQAAFPRLAAHAATHDWHTMRRTLLRTLAAVSALAIPALLALIFLGRPAIRILFEHGKFSHAAGTLTYKLLLLYAIALPAYAATEVLIRGLIALRDTRTPLISNGLQLATRALLIALLLDTLGAKAIPVALAAAATLETAALATILLYRLRRRIATA